jgi:uncharacterized protein (UPF0332 family)
VNREIDALAEHRMARARETQSEGDILLSQNAFSGAINRYYYAMFYGARSLLAFKGEDSSRHSGLQRR